MNITRASSVTPTVTHQRPPSTIQVQSFSFEFASLSSQVSQATTGLCRAVCCCLLWAASVLEDGESKQLARPRPITPPLATTLPKTACRGRCMVVKRPGNRYSSRTRRKLCHPIRRIRWLEVRKLQHRGHALRTDVTRAGFSSWVPASRNLAIL